MRVLQILPELNVGGVETGTVDFAKYLKKHHHPNIVISNGGELVDELTKCGIVHHTLPVHKKSLFTILRCIKFVRKIIIEDQIDIVHARSRVPGWIAFFACKNTNAEFITTCHGYYSRHLFGRVMGWSKYVIVPSEVIGRHMIDHFKVAAEQIRCIPRSVDLERFHLRRDSSSQSTNLVVSIVGRITPLKGHAYFLKAMAKVVRSFPFIKIWVIGDAPPQKEAYKQELEVLVKRLGLRDHVEFLGTRQDVPSLLSQTDVLVMASVVPEAFGRAIIEAQAVGVPVVATKIGGALEIVEHGKTGLLVYPKDIDAMAQAVIRLLKDKRLSQSLADAARIKLETEYTLENMCGKIISVYKELLSSKRILAVKMSSVGDVILVTASLKALRRKYPRAKIYCLVGKESRHILRKCPYIDELIVIDPRHKDRGIFAVLKFASKLRRHHFDMVVDFQNNLRSHLLAFFSFPRESFGFNNGKMGFLLKHKSDKARVDLPPVPHQFQILEMLGIPFDQEQHSLDLWLSENDSKKVQELLESEWVGQNQKMVGINIAASERWASKNWPVENIAKLCDLLAAQNIRVVITGLDKDKEEARRLISLTKTKPANLVGKTNITELAELIRRCNVFITPDSAPMHIAAAVRTPFIAFFGPTKSGRHLPPADRYSIFEEELECAPCYSSQCPIVTHVCMRNITPEAVFSQLKKMMT